MPEAVHPGSFVGDSIEEFKKLPTWGKFAAVAVVGIVIYLAIRARNAASATNSTGLTGSTTTSGTQSPFPMVGNVPLLPPGVNPIYDSSGNLVGYQSSNNTGTTTNSNTGTVTPPSGTNQQPNPTSGQSNNGALLSQLPAGFQDVLGAIFNYNGTQYSIVPGGKPGGPQTIYAVQGTGYTNQQLQNIPFGTNPGQKFLLYQGPAQNTQAAMNNQNQYLRSAMPHLPTPSNNAPGQQYKPVSVDTSGSPSATPASIPGGGPIRRM